MQHLDSYYPVPQCDDQIWTNWLTSVSVATSSWDQFVEPDTIDNSTRATSKRIKDCPMPLQYSITPPTPTSLDSSSLSSRLSVDTISEFDELPEIPFISGNSGPCDKYLDQEDYSPHDDDSERSFWSNIRPALSRSASDGTAAVLAPTKRRVLSPERRRAPSVSSTTSSRSRPAPTKSILASSASIRTRTVRSPGSVKFLETPTVHYEDEFEEECETERCRPASHAVKKRKLGFLERIIGSNKKARAVPERPVISGPFPLSDAFSCSTSDKASTRSLRSVRSNSSLRSTRSTSSRLHMYWDKLSGKDP